MSSLFSILDEARGVTSVGGIDITLLDCLPSRAMATLLLPLFAQVLEFLYIHRIIRKRVEIPQ
jgi:hypothetical protein